MRIKAMKRLPLFALVLVISVFLVMEAAYAATDPAEVISSLMETLSVDSVWLTGDTLHITVTDKDSGETQSLQLTLSDYAKSGDEYVTIQATDGYGRISDPIQFKNPYYVPPQSGGGNEPPPATSPAGETGESAVPDGFRPFTPDGTGTVVDNVMDGDGKEFFSISAEDGNIFYLIVDRQRNSDNVYLLNAVTEQDLMSLAQKGDGTVSAIPNVSNVTDPTPEPSPEPEQPTPVPANNNDGNNSLIFIVIAVIAVGGAAYYFKIVRPKQDGVNDYDDDEQDGFDDDTEINAEESDEDGGDDE